LPGEQPPPDETLRETLRRIYAHAFERATAAAEAKVEVGLTEVEERGYSIDEQIALHHADLRQQDANLRKRVAYWIIGVFIGANLVTMVALGILAWLDQGNIQSKLIAPGDRIITSQVFMALLGATTVQIGAIMVIIARYLFPGRSS
jgi:hypothetical protein